MKKLSVLLFLLFALMLSMKARAQQSEKITIRFTEKPFGEVLKEITKRYDLNFSYDQRLEILNRPVTLDVKGLSQEQFLKTLFEKAGANYKIINDHIAITEKNDAQQLSSLNEKSLIAEGVKRKEQKDRKENEFNKADVSSTKAEDLNQTASVAEVADDKNTYPLKKDSIVQESKVAAIQKDQVVQSPIANQSKLTTSSAEVADKEAPKKMHRMAIGPAASIDTYRFSRTIFEGSTSSVSYTANFSVGLDVQYLISDKWFLDMQAHLSKRSFDMDYHFHTIDSGDPFVIDKTSFHLQYITVPLTISYRILQHGDFTLHANAGIVVDFLVHEEVKTILKNGNDTTPPSAFGNLSSYAVGIQGSILLQYALSEKMKINLSPLYRHYATHFNDGVTGMHIRTMSLALGVVYRL